MNITVYLGSSMGENPIYKEAVLDLADFLVDKGHILIYGGSSSGLMGVLADRILEKGGKAYGIMPKFLQEHEKPHDYLTGLQMVDNLDQRKELLMEEGEILIALPGGLGTLEEISQAISWERVGKNSKPCVLLNINNYYGFLKLQFDFMVQEGFLSQADRDEILFLDDLEALELFITDYCTKKKTI